MKKRNRYKYSEERFYKQVYFNPIFPGFFGIITAAAPEWSPVYGIVWGIVMGLLILWTIICRMRNKHRSSSWRAFFGVINWDLTALLFYFLFGG
ncbi:MAG TPA: hypothetical protein VFK33_08060 [Bacillales bacterium]|nr:hypothetical protein [Bacillales bacterium]